MKEIWKDIKGYESLYQVSNLGKIKSLNYNSTGYEKIMKGSTSWQGYKIYRLTKNKVEKSFSGHRIVCLNFIKNPLGKEMVNHKNGVKHDNRLENLEWCTRSENEKHKYSHLGLISPLKGKFGKESIRAKVVYQYDLKLNMIKKWGSTRCVTKELGINYKNISSVCKGRRKTAGGFIWKH